MKVFFLLFWTLFPYCVWAGDHFPGVFSLQNTGKNRVGLIHSANSVAPGLALSFFYQSSQLSVYTSNSFLRQNYLSKELDILGKENWQWKNKWNHYAILGFCYKYFDLQLLHLAEKTHFAGLGLGISITQNKSIYLQYFQNPALALEQKRFLVLGKSTLGIGLEISQKTNNSQTENYLGFSFQLQINGVEGGASYASTDNLNNENYYLQAGYTFNARNDEYLWTEPNPYIEPEQPKSKIPISPKKLFIPIPKEKQVTTYNFTLQELLAKKIPLAEAMQIIEASKKPEEFKKFLDKLPSSTKGKVYGLLKEKNKKGK